MVDKVNKKAGYKEVYTDWLQFFANNFYDISICICMSVYVLVHLEK